MQVRRCPKARPNSLGCDRTVSMATTIYDVLEQLRASAISEADKGAKFERLMKAYLKIDLVFVDQFADVWLWSEYPGNHGKHDTGIDLVARDRNTGHDVAIQCKFFAPSTPVSKPMIDSFLAISGKEGYRERIIISTSDRWNANAEDAIRNQTIPVRRIGLSDLEASRVDWSAFSLDTPEKLTLSSKKTPRDHQRIAIDKVVAGFGAHDRGKLVMACGTGKTFTSLKLTEENVGPGGKILFLVPSINLLSQTVREWLDNADVPIRPIAVCSDPKSTRHRSKTNVYEDISVTDLALPATTNIAEITRRISEAESDKSAMTVVFSTYQSINVIAEAQRSLKGFDLIIADEAHRTTGTTLAGEDESNFVKVHNNGYLPAAKRLYMTATPRIYDDSSKAKAGEANAVLASMDNENLFGPEFHRLGFGEAVERELLTDYKVLVLTVDQESVARALQVPLSDDGNELKLDDAAKIVGCWNGLAKRGKVEHSFEPDIAPMRRAIAFAGNIAESKRIEELFQSVTDYYVNATDQENSDGSNPLKCMVQHVDGGMNALERNTKLDWLRGEPADGTCQILTNARCLSEGVDVPALDAVMFLSPRKSVVDIVQSVGRVMRLDPKGEKKFGYIILPIGIPSGMTPEEALRDNKRYAVVWEILQALRAHDERFDALVNRISLSKARDRKVNVIGVGGDQQWGDQATLDLVFPDLDQWRDAIYAKIVQKVGSREYWTDWAKDVASIAGRQITRISALLKDPQTGVRKEFDEFLDGIRGNLNDNITENDAVEMLAQHLITRPVFNALFAGDDFLDGNPVAVTMEKMLAVLDQHDLEAENESLHKFYDSVRRKVADVKDREGRQELVRRLYDTFFATAFKKTVDKLGIVYTPVQVVDFILRSTDEVLKAEFSQSLSDEGVHILDGFTGTGTFIVRLLELGLIKPHDLARKYTEELHANEILLLAYYIAAVNIETTYMGIKRSPTEPSTEEGDAAERAAGKVEYESFPGLVLTDTFQSWEDDDRPDLNIFPENNHRLERLKKLPITVIIGNPPYSVGQGSANDNNANEKYPSLDGEIRATYAERSTAINKNSLYNSYIRAIKWASLRVKDRGVIAYVTANGFLDSNSADGLRKSLADEFAKILILDLKGNQKGDWRREGGKIFGEGSQSGIAIVLLVKDSTRPGPAVISYSSIGDFLSREEKLSKVTSSKPIAELDSTTIIPNTAGDWLNQRSDAFMRFLPLVSGSGDQGGLFADYGPGLQSNRDPWVYNSSKMTLTESMTLATESYLAALKGDRTNDSTRIKWSSSLAARLERGEVIRFDPRDPVVAMYRPFERTFRYPDMRWAHRPGVSPRTFPTVNTPNVGIVITGVSSHAPFSFLAVDREPNQHVLDTTQFFPRWTYESTQDAGMLDIAVNNEVVIDGYRKVDNITDEALKRFQATYRSAITKDDIFFYIYGLLHSPDYRETYAADLKKMLPRIPLVDDPWPFVEAGRELSELHTGYESMTRYPLDGLEVESDGDPYDFFAVQKMVFTKKRDPETKKLVADKSAIVYNSRITLSGIPDDAHRYLLGSRSAIEWIIDRYQVKTDKPSGIVNDPNNWSREVGDPRYIVDLLARIVTVSLQTMQIVDNLPALAIQKNQTPK